MSLAEELVILYKLHKDGGLTEAEFINVKTQMLRDNPKETAALASNFKKDSKTASPVQVGAMAAAGTFAARLVADHLKNDKQLRQQIENIQAGTSPDAIIYVVDGTDDPTQLDDGSFDTTFF